jgi:hypothetical protein
MLTDNLENESFLNLRKLFLHFLKEKKPRCRIVLKYINIENSGFAFMAQVERGRVVKMAWPI